MNFILKIIQKNSENYFNILKFIFRIFKLFSYFLILKTISKIFNIFLKIWYYVARHVAKVAQSATATWPKLCQLSWIVEPGTFSKQIFFYRDVFQFFFLQRQESKLDQITGTIIIFKPSFYKTYLIFSTTLIISLSTYPCLFCIFFFRQQ